MWKHYLVSYIYCDFLGSRQQESVRTFSQPQINTQANRLTPLITGLGENWLQAAQPHLARVQSEENSEEAVRQVESPLYVEARGYLQPAADFYKRAVRAAGDGGANGKLLSTVSFHPLSFCF